MGINGTSLRWFKNYLGGRSQKVDINGSLSRSRNLDISVLQGSILGPILFLCFINDLYSASNLMKLMFADDTACLAAGKDLPELIVGVNAELKKIANWFRSNRMALNTEKTKFMIFHTKGKTINPNLYQLSYDANEIGKPIDPNLVSHIECVPHYKLLGVTIDDKMTFDSHVKILSGKIAKSLFCIRRVKNFLPIKSLTTLYYSMIHPHFLYCINLYGCTSNKNIDLLFKKQKQAVRCLTNSTFRQHTNPLFKSLCILPLKKLIELEKAKFMHKFTYKRLPTSFENMWMKNNALHAVRELRNAEDLRIPHHNHETLRKLPIFEFPSYWNGLQDVKFIENFTTFKICLKNNLLEEIEDE